MKTFLYRFDVKGDPIEFVRVLEIAATISNVNAFNIARARDSFTVSPPRETDIQAASNKSRYLPIPPTCLVASAPLNSQWNHDYAIVRKFMAGRRAFHYSAACISRAPTRFLARRISAAGAAVSLNFHR